MHGTSRAHAGAVLGCALVAAAVAATLELVWPPAFIDLSVYRFGGSRALDGAPLYAGSDPGSGLPFTYPPFAALLLAPLALLPSAVAAAGLAGAAVAALGSVVHLLVPRLPAAWLAAATAGLVVLEPVEQTLTFGQVNLLLMLLVTVAVLDPDRRSSPWLLGVAAGVKLTPLVFVVFLALAGRRSTAARATAARATGVFGATVALGFLVLPGSAATYWTSAVWDPDRVGGAAFVSNQSVNGSLTRLLGGEPPTVVWLLVAGVVSLATLVVGVLWWRRGRRDLGLALAGLSMLLASPISWSHHWVWVVPVVLAVPRTAPVVVAVLATRLLWWPPHRDERELGWGLTDQVVGNAYVLLALAFAAASASVLRRSPSSPPVPQDRPDPEHGGDQAQHDDGCDTAAHSTAR